MAARARSLFGRTVLIVSLMMMLSYSVAMLLFAALSTRSSIINNASNLTRQVISIGAAIKLLPANKRLQYANALYNRKQLRMFASVDPFAKPGIKPAGHFQDSLAKILHHNVKALTEVRFQRIPQTGNPEPSIKELVWLKFSPDKRNIWIGLPVSKLKPDLGKNLVLQIIIILVLTVLTALLITWQLNRPLASLIQAADKLGKGENIEPLALTGPREIRDLCQTFNQMADDINKLADDRNLLLAGVSHDLRTPLTRMRLALEMIDTSVDAELRSGIMQDVQDMETIISQFLAFIKNSAEELAQPLDLNQLVSEACERYVKAGNEVRFVAVKLPVQKLKPMAIKRLLSNLIDNALIHGKPPVIVSTIRDPDGVSLCIDDHGAGIPTDQIESLCTPFSRRQAKSSRTGDNTHHGAGLGLAIVKRIVQALDARLYFETTRTGEFRIRIKWLTTGDKL